MIDKRIDRREFLKKSAECTAFAAVGLSTPALLRTTALAAGEPDIVVADGLPGPAAKAAVKALGGMKRFVKPDGKVVVKPNMSFSDPPSRATNTHPRGYPRAGRHVFGRRGLFGPGA